MITTVQFAYITGLVLGTGLTLTIQQIIKFIKQLKNIDQINQHFRHLAE